MRLEDIGFYTLSDNRAKKVSWESDLQRCELILTDRCNFKCAYCRGIKPELRGDLTLDQAKEVIDIWADGNIHNIRFSGGEPTIWPDLLELVKYTKLSVKSIEHIALSTNGSAPLYLYLGLCDAGVNDFSISLDACCSMNADLMAGTTSKFNHISEVIKELSNRTYVTVGVVLDERNLSEVAKIIEYAEKLGVSDIRIIPSAQYNKIEKIHISPKHSILKYRINNINDGLSVRGMTDDDCKKCHLVKDDMVVLNGKHFPCVIYMREQGAAIGDVYNKTIKQIREERKLWFECTSVLEDDICKKNCLDVCIAHNNRVEFYEKN